MAEDTQNQDDTEAEEQLDPQVEEPEELVSVDEFLVTRHQIRARGATVVPVLPASRRDDSAESDWERSSTHTDGGVLSVVWVRRVQVKASELKAEPESPHVGPAQAPSTGMRSGFNAPVPPTPGYAVVREHGSMGGFSVRERGVATVAPASGSAPLRPGSRGVVSGAEVSVRPYQGDVPPFEGSDQIPQEPVYNPPGPHSRISMPQGEASAFGAVAYRPRAGVAVTGARGARQQRPTAPIDPRVFRHHQPAAPQPEEQEPSQQNE